MLTKREKSILVAALDLYAAALPDVELDEGLAALTGRDPDPSVRARRRESDADEDHTVGEVRELLKRVEGSGV